MSWWNGLAEVPASHLPVKVSTRTLAAAVEDALIDAFTRKQLEVVLKEELHLQWDLECTPADAETKRDLIRGYNSGQTVPQLVALARTIVNDYPITSPQLADLLSAYMKPLATARPPRSKRPKIKLRREPSSSHKRGTKPRALQLPEQQWRADLEHTHGHW